MSIISSFVRYGVFVLGLLTIVPAANAQGQRQSTTQTAQRYALLIAVNDYSPPLGKLEFCQNDMTVLRDHLVAAGFPGGNVILMSDNASESRMRPTKFNIESELTKRLQLANANDLFLVAFSGHGLHLEGKSYACPNDAKIDDKSSLVSIDQIYQQMEKCRCGEKLLIIDACRNEPILKGFKGSLPEDLNLKFNEPPKGLWVLSSCAPGQFSTEDPKLRHGVFMHYIMKGLEGEADSGTDGNKDGKVALHELYFYAEHQTKMHVIESFGMVQRPTMYGTMEGGRIDLAMVPDAARLKELQKPRDLPAPAKNVDSVKSPSPGLGVDPALIFRKAKDLYNKKEYAAAISEYNEIFANHNLPVEAEKTGKMGRGDAYRERGSKEDVEQALADYKSAGCAGIYLLVKAPSANLMVGSAVKEAVKQNEWVLVTKIEGNWLWVEQVNQNETRKRQGYIPKDAVIQKTEVAAQPANTNTPTVRSAGPINNGGGYGNGGGGIGGLGNGGYGMAETAAERAQLRKIETKERELDRAYNWGASQGTIRTKERELNMMENRFNRMRGGR